MSETSAIGAIATAIRPAGDRNGSRLPSQGRSPENAETPEAEEATASEPQQDLRQPPPPGIGIYIDRLV